MLTVNAGRSAPGKPGWLHKVNKLFSETGSDPGQCHTHQTEECLPPACALDPEETCAQQRRHPGWDVRTQTWGQERLVGCLSLHLSLTSLTSDSLEKSHCLSWAPRHSPSSWDSMKWSTTIVRLRMYEASDVTSSNFAWIRRGVIFQLY